MSKKVTLWLLCSFLYVQLFSLAASFNIAHLQQQLPDNVALICTGKQFRFISLSEFELSGEIVFIEAPNNVKHVALDCASLICVEQEDDSLAVVAMTPFSSRFTDKPSFEDYIAESKESRFFFARAPPAFT